MIFNIFEVRLPFKICTHAFNNHWCNLLSKEEENAHDWI